VPWHIVPDSAECPKSKPYAVVKDSDGEIMGCHATKKAAQAQLAALNIAEDEARGRKMADGHELVRTVPLLDITIRAEGDGRTVEAYAAVFNQRVAVSDFEGEYEEIILPTAFDRSLTRKGTNFQVFFNHGLTIHGMSSDRYSMPLGVPLEVRADRRGLFTVTQYAKTELADEVLELIRAGGIRGMSFSGRPGPSKRTAAGRAGLLPLVERQEIALREFGPTPFPVYEKAAIVGVRAEELVATLAGLTPQERADLVNILQGTPDPLAGNGPVVNDPPATDPDDPPAGATGPVVTGPSLDLLERDIAARRRVA